MSMLDVISGGLGAFILLAIIFMPYYKKETKDVMQELKNVQSELQQTQTELTQAKQQNEQQAQELTQAQQQNEQQAQELARMKEEAKRSMLAIYIRWETLNQDVDLHVVDPTGAEFSFHKTTIENRPGKLTKDMTKGPGVEVWELRKAEVGTYYFNACLYSKGGNSQWPTVQGNLFYRDGSKEINVKLNAEKQMVSLLVVKVNEDGSIDITEGNAARIASDC